MGGRGAVSSTGVSGGIGNLQKQFDKLQSRNEAIYYAVHERGETAMPREYYDNQKKMQSLRTKIDDLESKQVADQNKKNPAVKKNIC